MAKKERLGSDPFKEGPLGWIQDTREDKADSKELKSKKTEELKPQNVLTSKRQSVKALKRFNVKTSKQDKVKESEPKKRHTIYLSFNQSKKLKVYAAENNMKLSEIIEKLINENV
jgi:Lon protease-like protein